MPKLSSILGIDVGRHSAKVVRAVPRGKSIAITHAETLQLPPAQQNIGEVVAGWIEKLGLAKTPCAVNMPGRSVMFQPMALAADDPRTPSQAVSVEIARYNELASESMVYAFAPVSPAADERRLLLSMARPVVLDAALNAYRNAELDVIDLVPTAVAVFNALVGAAGEDRTPCVFADVGHSATEIAVGTADGLLFARSFASAGLAFTEAVGKAVGMGAMQAEYYKVENGSIAAGEDAQRAALRKAADMWVSELESCLAVYRSVYAHPSLQPHRLVITGGGAALDGFAAYVARRAGMDLAAPAIPGGADAATAARYACAAGLAISGLGRGVSRLSLLPPRAREELNLRWQKTYWVASGAIGALVLGVCLAGGYWDLRSEQKELRIRGASLRRCQAIASQIDAIKADNLRIRAMETPIVRLIDSGPIARDLLDLLARSKDPNDMITMVSDAATYFAKGSPKDAVKLLADERERRKRNRGPERAPARGDYTTRDPLRCMVVEGYTPQRGLQTVRKLVTNVNAAPGFKADLLSDDLVVQNAERDAEFEKRGATRFVLEVEVNR